MEDRTKTGTNLKLTRETKIYLSRFASSSGNLLSTFRRIYTSNLTTREQRETQYLYARASSSFRCSSDEDARAIIAFIGEKLRLSGLASFRLLRGPTIYANVVRVFLLYPRLSPRFSTRNVASSRQDSDSSFVYFEVANGKI